MSEGVVMATGCGDDSFGFGVGSWSAAAFDESRRALPLARGVACGATADFRRLAEDWKTSVLTD